MKKLYFLIIIMLITVLVINAQTPQGINYQGMARDNSGNVLANQTVSLRFSVLSGNINGNAVYVETQTTTTDGFGLFLLMIGQGTAISGTFTSISWGSNTYFLKAEMDATGGTAFQFLGTSQFAAVPYALYSEKSGTTITESQSLSINGNNLSISGGNTVALPTGNLANGTVVGQIAYWNGTAWSPISAGTQGQNLTLCDGIPTWGPCLATLSTTLTSYTSTQAVAGGIITGDGNSTVTQRGVCYSISPNPTTANNISSNGSGIGTFTSNLTGLTANTTYYIRSYAITSAGTSYGNQMSFTTSVSTAFVLSGGTITTVGSDKVHTFTSSGTLTVTGSGTVRILVVGGGSSGARGTTDGYGGGGGGGGEVKDITVYVSPGTYSVSIGSGGAQVTSTSLGNPGGSSSITGIISANGAPATNNGNGVRYGTSSGNGIYSQYSGGNGCSLPSSSANGSIGIASNITGVSVIYGSGGGAGGGSISGGQGLGAGGAGEGGHVLYQGSNPPYWICEGAANKGGGGGGASNSPPYYGYGLAGGSGVVIIRYTEIY